MFLEKWYADVASGENVAIYYRANLHLGPLRIGFCAGFESGGERRTSFALGAGAALPAMESRPGGDRLLLPEESGASGPLAWESGAPCCPLESRPMELWSDGRRRVVWDPVAPNAAVRQAAKDGVCEDWPCLGRGYAEKLVMTVAPWRLGLRRLWWGRFCGGQRSLVWICWEGRCPLQVALVDGKRASLDAVCEDRVVASPAFRLDLGERRLLVDEAIGAGALARAPWPKRVAPLAFLAGRERKWFARGALSEAGEVVDTGDVICEVVEWT